MSDAERVWREAEGQSKQKTVRTIWPALAAALDGAGPASTETQQPACHGCSTQLAIGRADDIPVCGRCAGLRPFCELRLSRVTGWRAGAVKRA